MKHATQGDFTATGITEILNRDQWAILTPENPNNTPATEEQNAGYRLKFEKFLRDNDVQFLKANDNYGYPETSYILVGVSAENAIGLGRLFKQQSVLTREGLVECTTGKVTPAVKVVVDPLLENYYTDLPDGTRFCVELA